MQEVNVLDEERGSTITLHVTEQDFIRIHSEPDQVYLKELLLKFYENEDQNSGEQETNEDGESSQAVFSANEDRPIFIWSNECVMLLLSLYEAVDDWQLRRHKKIYDEIATKMQNMNPAYKVNGSQCQSKMGSLRKQYKKIKDHNATSGNDRLTWPYFERMDEIFGNRHSITPCAVASEAGPGPASEPLSSQNKESRKRKIDSLLEDILENSKVKQRDRKEMLNQFLNLKKQQHEEKMNVLKELCNNLKNNK